MSDVPAQVSSKTVQEFIDWAWAGIHGLPGARLRLPPVQRSALWSSKKIVDLWDSLLRGMPIGMFYLIPACGAGRSLIDGEDMAASDGDLDLLDGQQRLLAMLLAKRPLVETGKCLWIAFDANPDSEDGLPLRLTTRARPFGFKPNGGKFDTWEAKEARDWFDNRHPKLKELHDFQLFDKMLEAGSLPPRPKGCEHALPMRRLAELWAGAGRNEGVFVGRVLGEVGAPAALASVSNIVGALARGFGRMEIQPVALLQMAALGSGDTASALQPAQAGSVGDWLLQWFARIGAGGVPLTAAELNYSIYKHHEPSIHQTVSRIETVAGRMLAPLEIVETAVRIANMQRPNGEGSPAALDPAAFGREMASEASTFRENLDDLIPKGGKGADGSLARVMACLKDALLYCEQCNPKGLPRLLVARLPDELLQVFAYWIYLNRSEPVGHAERQEMVRFSLFWWLCANKNDRCRDIAFRTLAAAADGRAGKFPGHRLYQAIIADPKAAYRLVAPLTMQAFGTSSHPGNYTRTKEEVLNPPTIGGVAWPDGVRELFDTWWYSRGKVLLWLQRAYLEKRIPAYDPLSDRDDDTAFDLDHIVPAADWSGVIGGNRLDKEAKPDFDKGRDMLGNSIGNFRWITAAENRRDGAASPRRKLLWKSHSNVARDEPPSEIDWAVGIFPLPAEEVWWEAAGDDCDKGSRRWTPDRITAFRNAVEGRVLALYDQFWDEAGFTEWELSPGLNPAVGAAE